MMVGLVVVAHGVDDVEYHDGAVGSSDVESFAEPGVFGVFTLGFVDSSIVKNLCHFAVRHITDHLVDDGQELIGYCALHLQQPVGFDRLAGDVGAEYLGQLISGHKGTLPVYLNGYGGWHNLAIADQIV